MSVFGGPGNGPPPPAVSIFTPVNPLSTWTPGTSGTPVSGPVLLGTYTIPLGPLNIQMTRTPNVVEQVTRNSIFLWAYGYLPQTYVMEGYPNGGSIDAMNTIVQQFGDSELTVLRLVIPSLKVQDYVRLTKWEPRIMQSTGWGEPFYHMELASAGPDIVAGVTTL